MMNSNKGFTLLELMVVIAIVAIMISIATPSFRAQIEASRLRADTDNVVTALQFARSEAVTRRADVTASNFAGGASVAQGATAIRVFPAQSSGVVITGATITYRANGSVAGVQRIKVIGTSDARTICVNFIGQARVLVGDVACP
jgi:type IV fimbrial biogenesis protein FimT